MRYYYSLLNYYFKTNIFIMRSKNSQKLNIKALFCCNLKLYAL